MRSPLPMLVPTIASVSAAMLGVPVAARCAPAGESEFAQPLPAAPELPHGHAVPLPSPKQNGTCGVKSTMSIGRCDGSGFVRELKRFAVGVETSSVELINQPRLV